MDPEQFVSPTLLTLSDEKAIVIEQLHTQGLPICGVRHLRSWFRMWKIKARAAKLTRRTRQRAHHDQKVYNQQIIADISISLEHEDPAEAWRLTRRLAGNNRGSRKRRYVAPLSAPAEKEDWGQYLSPRENGGNGSCFEGEDWTGIVEDEETRSPQEYSSFSDEQVYRQCDRTQLRRCGRYRWPC